jgi:hypothetical protein
MFRLGQILGSSRRMRIGNCCLSMTTRRYDAFPTYLPRHYGVSMGLTQEKRILTLKRVAYDRFDCCPVFHHFHGCCYRCVASLMTWLADYRQLSIDFESITFRTSSAPTSIPIFQTASQQSKYLAAMSNSKATSGSIRNSGILAAT